MDSLISDIFESKIVEIKAKENQSSNYVIRAKLLSKDDAAEWLRLFKERSSTDWIVKAKKQLPDSKYAKYEYNKDYFCHHSSYRKLSTSKKSTGCMATLSIRVKKKTSDVRYKDEFARQGFYGIITLDNNHNHLVQNAEALNWLRRTEDVKATFLQYFDTGKGPSQALSFHQDLLMADGVCKLADSSVNPPAKWVYELHDMWRKTNFGDITGTLDFRRAAQERVMRLKTEGHLAELSEEPFSLTLITPLMQRALKLDEKGPHTFFVDTSASCDQTNTSLTLVLIATKAGAVPIGVTLHDGQSEASYAAAFSQLKSLWEHLSVSDNYIACFMTDDSKAMKAALKANFKNSCQLLCRFHVAQAVWRWLCDSKHSISKQSRQEMMESFSTLMRTRDAAVAEEAFQKMVDMDDAEVASSRFCGYICDLWNRKEEWCMAFRNKVLCRGHNTNNFAEASFRIVKDIVLTRLRAFNAVALLDYIAVVMERYYEKRLTQAAFGRNRQPDLVYNSTLQKASSVLDLGAEAVTKLDDVTYSVASTSNESVRYTVWIDSGVCTCAAGEQGCFCKHQAAVHIRDDVVFRNSPDLSMQYKSRLYFVATGKSDMKATFFLPMATLPELNASPSELQPTSSTHCHVVKLETEDVPMNIEDAEVMQLANADLEERQTTYGSSLQCLRSHVDRIFTLLANHSNDDGALRFINKMSADLAEIRTIGDISAAYLSPRLFNSIRSGRKIKVQPTSISRRKQRGSAGSSRSRCGRPMLGVKRRRPAKQKRNLEDAIVQNRPNAKSHGEDH